MSGFRKLKLTYFPLPGRGQAIRDAFKIGNIPFEDERVPYDEFPKQKEAGRFPLGSMPILTIDDTLVISQSNAILRYVGKLAGLYPSDPILALKVDFFLDSAEEMGSFANAAARAPTDEERKKIREDMNVSVLPNLRWFFAAYERTIDQDGFLVGNSLTIADLKLHGQFNTIASGRWNPVDIAIVEKYPKLNGWYQNIKKVVAEKTK